MNHNKRIMRFQKSTNNVNLNTQILGNVCRLNPNNFPKPTLVQNQNLICLSRVSCTFNHGQQPHGLVSNHGFEQSQFPPGAPDVIGSVLLEVGLLDLLDLPAVLVPVHEYLLGVAGLEVVEARRRCQSAAVVGVLLVLRAHELLVRLCRRVRQLSVVVRALGGLAYLLVAHYCC